MDPTTASAGDPKPIVYSCSGASSAAQMANYLAVKMDRERLADMSCIAGVGGDVPSLVRTAQSGRPIIALDGCALNCSLHILKRHAITPDKHYLLTDFGVKKRQHTDFSPAEAEEVLAKIRADVRADPTLAATPAAVTEPVASGAASPR